MNDKLFSITTKLPTISYFYKYNTSIAFWDVHNEKKFHLWGTRLEVVHKMRQS